MSILKFESEEPIDLGGFGNAKELKMLKVNGMPARDIDYIIAIGKEANEGRLPYKPHYGELYHVCKATHAAYIQGYDKQELWQELKDNVFKGV